MLVILLHKSETEKSKSEAKSKKDQDDRSWGTLSSKLQSLRQTIKWKAESEGLGWFWRLPKKYR